MRTVQFLSFGSLHSCWYSQLHCRFNLVFFALFFFIFIPVSRTIVFFCVASLSVLYSLLFFLFSFSVGVSSSFDQKFVKWTETQTIRILIEESWLGNFDFMDRLIKIHLLNAIFCSKKYVEKLCNFDSSRG